mmetsp:Transcript_7531/g.18169  ORF Transcript_7531/g.18169 Transcript_7531/m.18169 type:complete len:240 (-) Transcript_7531:139-858(-)
MEVAVDKLAGKTLPEQLLDPLVQHLELRHKGVDAIAAAVHLRALHVVVEHFLAARVMHLVHLIVGGGDVAPRAADGVAQPPQPHHQLAHGPSEDRRVGSLGEGARDQVAETAGCARRQRHERFARLEAREVARDLEGELLRFQRLEHRVLELDATSVQAVVVDTQDIANARRCVDVLNHVVHPAGRGSDGGPLILQEVAQRQLRFPGLHQRCRPRRVLVDHFCDESRTFPGPEHADPGL